MKKEKVLYIGHLNEASGWSEAAKNLIFACDYVGIDVVCRSILLDKNIEAHPKIEELKRKSSLGCSAVIQHVLPHFYEYNSECGKNIGYFVGEGSSFKRIGWEYRARLLDEIWVPNYELTHCLGEDINTKVVHHAHDISNYTTKEKPIIEDSSYKFYTIMDFVNRKNITDLLKAFHCEFNINDNVCLVVKISHSNLNEKEVFNEFSKINNEVSRKLRKHKEDSFYKNIHIIANRLNDKEMRSLHQSCDCYISLSHGEAWNYPLADAIFHGNECIASDVGGHREYVPMSSGILVPGVMEPAEGYDSLPNYQTCHDEWFVPNIKDAMSAMRQKYKESQNTPVFQKIKEEKMKKNKELVNMYSFEAVGNRIKNLLYGDMNG